MGSASSIHLRSGSGSGIHSLPACSSCGDKLPPNAQFCPGCGRNVIQPKSRGTQVGIAPRTDQPLKSAQPLTETQADIHEVANFLPERYKPMKKIGQGGMGTVYQCHDRALERQVAIKVMMDRYRSDPQGERRFMREARAQAIVNHPNVCTVLNFGISQEGRPFLVMEYLEGLDLRSILRMDKVFDPVRACGLVKQVCDGLQEAHSAGLVHRDLKPSNVMIVKDHRGDERAKILDLGLAKIVGGPTDLKSITMDTAGMLVGTPAYMSPEQVAGSSVDGRADLYALGVVFFELLTGRLPYESETMEGWLYQHLHAKPPPPTQFNRALMKYPALDRLVLWLLSKQPKDRPASAGEMAQILARLLEKNLEGEAPRARRSGPRAALAFEENPPAKKSGPRAALDAMLNAPLPPPDGRMNAVGDVINPAPAPHVFDAEAEKEKAEKRARYEESSNAAEAAESARNWRTALEFWEQSLPLAEKPETVQSRMQACRREMEFEDQLERANRAAGIGDWEDAIKTTDRLSRQRPTDPRIEQLRARLPQRLIESWQRLAHEKGSLVPEGDIKQSILERLAIAYAQTGDMQSAVVVLDGASRKAEIRAIGLAQAIVGAVQNAQHEGLRPHLDSAASMAAGVGDPSERGRAQLEVGRAYAAYGDENSSAQAFQAALASFGESLAKGIPMHAAAKRAAQNILRRQTDMRSVLLTTTSMTGPKALKSSYEYAVGTVAEAQAETGLVEDALASAATIDDAWTFAHTLSKVAQAFARIGRLAEAENLSHKIGFAMPKTQAFRAVAVSKIYAGELSGAEEILKIITAPADRMAIFGLLATAYALRKDNGRASQRISEIQKCVAEVSGARSRSQALIAAAEPLLQSGFVELAGPLVAEASKLLDLIDDPAERVRSILQQGMLLETARDSKIAATRTIIMDYKPSHEFIETLKRSLVVWRQVRQPSDRLECIERVSFTIAWGEVPELYNEAIGTCRDNAESALAYIGFCAGMA